jgi:hypothetical protein
MKKLIKITLGIRYCLDQDDCGDLKIPRFIKLFYSDLIPFSLVHQWSGCGGEEDSVFMLKISKKYKIGISYYYSSGFLIKNVIYEKENKDRPKD